MEGTAFADRGEAGRAVAGHLRAYAARSDVVILALPRGGVPVAAEVARALDAPLDLVVVRKLGLPGRPELAMGAVATVGGHIQVFRNEAVLSRAEVSPTAFAEIQDREIAELVRRVRAYRGDRPPPAVAGRTLVVVDDGLATGSTALAAVTALRRQAPGRLVLAVPVGSLAASDAVRPLVDELVVAWTPEHFRAVSLAYVDFRPTSEAEVRAALGSTPG